MWECGSRRERKEGEVSPRRVVVLFVCRNERDWNDSFPCCSSMVRSNGEFLTYVASFSEVDCERKGRWEEISESWGGDAREAKEGEGDRKKRNGRLTTSHEIEIGF